MIDMEFRVQVKNLLLSGSLFAFEKLTDRWRSECKIN